MFTLTRGLDLFLTTMVTLNTTEGGKQLSFTLFLCPYVDAQPLQMGRGAETSQNNGRTTSHEKPLE
jgi:hypothetical protein